MERQVEQYWKEAGSTRCHIPQLQVEEFCEEGAKKHELAEAWGSRKTLELADSTWEQVKNRKREVHLRELKDKLGRVESTSGSHKRRIKDDQASGRRLKKLKYAVIWEQWGLEHVPRREPWNNNL